ncbi:MAG: GGDEF domain-containing protein [Massilia sp.]
MDHIANFGASGYALTELQLFRNSNHRRLAAALANCPVIGLAQDEQLAEGQNARLYIVLRGALLVAAGNRDGIPEGGNSKVLPGESIGEQAVLDDASNLAAMTALVPSELLVIDADLVWQLIDEHNEVARNLLRLLSFRIRAANALLRRRQKVGEFYRQLSMNDGLTGLYNRGWLDDMLPRMVATAQRGLAPLSLVMIDLDHFKLFNDTHGHLAGDDALRAAAGVINAALRPSDFAVRFGGEEMLVILPDTDSHRAMMVAERLCARMRLATVFDHAGLPRPHLTASFGVASLAPTMDETALMAAADAALYRAKQTGRDRVSL